MTETTLANAGNQNNDTQIYILTAVLFISYLCVAIPLPIVPLFVSVQLHLDTVWAGLSVGIAFFSTIVTRGYAGRLSDKRGAKLALGRGLVFYTAGSLISLLSGSPSTSPWPTFFVLVAGRLVVGFGESLIAVGVIAWGIGMVGPARSGRVLSLMGAAAYAALAVGGPLGLALFGRFGFSGAMGVSALLPCLGLVVIWRIPGVAPTPSTIRSSLWAVLGRIWLHGSVVCLQGIGFAAIGAFFALYCLDHHWGNAGLGLTAFGVGFVLVRLVLGHLPDRVGGLTVSVASLAVECVGQLMIWSASDPTLALVGAFLTGSGCSMIFPAMGREVVHLVPPQQRGTAVGGYSAFQDLAYGLTGPLAGLVASRSGYASVFLIGASAAGIGLVVAAYLRRRSTIALLSPASGSAERESA